MDELVLIEYLKKHGMEKLVNDAIKEMAIDHFSKSKMEVAMADEDSDSHFSEEEAKEEVSHMYHCHYGKKYVGEKFSMTKAHEVQLRYRGMIPDTITVADIYVAINALYHDYATIFKSWFGCDIDEKIIESALIFWFHDEDYAEGSKLYTYFHH